MMNLRDLDPGMCCGDLDPGMCFVSFLSVISAWLPIRQNQLQHSAQFQGRSFEIQLPRAGGCHRCLTIYIDRLSFLFERGFTPAYPWMHKLQQKIIRILPLVLQIWSKIRARKLDIMLFKWESCPANKGASNLKNHDCSGTASQVTPALPCNATDGKVGFELGSLCRVGSKIPTKMVL